MRSRTRSATTCSAGGSPLAIYLFSVYDCRMEAIAKGIAARVWLTLAATAAVYLGIAAAPLVSIT